MATPTTKTHVFAATFRIGIGIGDGEPLRPPTDDPCHEWSLMTATAESGWRDTETSFDGGLWIIWLRPRTATDSPLPVASHPNQLVIPGA